ncbi:MAG: hypothetical protein IPK97_10380 [Ahniella sp.]|nr:hypothetical protein [Ahniella sp.]
MTICPIALAVGCKKCPVFSICPATRTLGDQKDEAPPAAASTNKPAQKKNTKAKTKNAGKSRKR